MNKFEKTVAERVVKELDKRGIKQSQLVKLCGEIGMPISQPDISKICTGKKGLNLYQMASISKVIGIPMDFFVFGEEGYRKDFCDVHDSAGLIAFGPDLEHYEGEFHFYYLSTAAGENKILHGLLRIYKEKGFFEISLKLDTGEENRQGEVVVKEYLGRLLVSVTLEAAYLILKSETLGEMCMICLRHRNYNVKDMECRVGLALTMSAGERKEPAVHRCLLIREDLDEELQERLRPWLNMVGEEIRVERGRLEKLKKGLQEIYPDYGDELEGLEDIFIKREYAETSVEMLRKQLAMPQSDFMNFLTDLYSVADNSKNYRISQIDDIHFYERMIHLSAKSHATYHRQAPRSALTESPLFAEIQPDRE